MIWPWVGFLGLIFALLALDLGVFHSRARIVTMKESLAWSAVWISLGLGFSGVVYIAYEAQWCGLGTQIDLVDGEYNDGATATEKYLTGYVVEKSLSVDNIFVIAMIFGFFSIPAQHQHRVLFWGIVGALLLRGVMIAIGATLLHRFAWLLYVFGAFLIFTALKMMFIRTNHSDPDMNVFARFARWFFPVTRELYDEHFLVRAQPRLAAEKGTLATYDPAMARVAPGTWMLTPLFLALIVVETTDVIFAVDSIPAIFAITADPFLVFTSNVFAILGLRALYFALAGMLDKFCYLKFALAQVLLVVGLKMFFAETLKDWLGKHFNLYLLVVIFSILTAGVLASLFAQRPCPPLVSEKESTRLPTGDD